MGQTPPPASRLCFSTLGCPDWDWETVLRHAKEWGYSAVELRGLHGEMDLTNCPQFSEVNLASTLRQIADAGLRISDLGSSVKLHEVEPAKRAVQMDEGRRYIDLAHRLGVPYIRVFGDRILPDRPKAETVSRIGSGLAELGAYANTSGVTILIESHGEFCDSPTLLQILRGANHPNVALLWDAHHTVVVGKEDPAHTLEQGGSYVRHVHLKDSKPEGKDVRYVLTGEGTIPLRRIVQLLVQRQYPGYFSFEWEKVWHPTIPAPEIAFPGFAQKMRAYLES